MRLTLFSLFLVFSNISYAVADNAQKNAQTLHDQACDIEHYLADDPWHIANLYNCSTRQLFIPYQLWTGETLSVWERHRPHRNASKYYACHERGIGSIHNPKKPKEQFVEGLCQAPGGHGWMIGKRRTCIKVTLEITDLKLDENNHLSSLEVKYWWRDKLRFAHTYIPNEGIKSIYLYPR